MLRLLQTPLNRLSDALGRMQEDTQRLRAVLYDPSRAIFAAAPTVLKYFEEGSTIRHGNVSWLAQHDLDREGVDVRVLRCTLAAIVCEIFGGLVVAPENDGALWNRAQSYLGANAGNEDVAEGAAYKRLREQCKYIIGSGETEELPSDIGSLKNACSNLKDILYRPYKDGDKNWSLLAAFIIFFDVFSKIEVSIHLDDEGYKKAVRYSSLGESMKQWRSAVPLMCGLDLPVARYSHWLSFIHGVLSYAKHD